MHQPSFGGINKRVVNNYLASIVNIDDRVALLDSRTLGTSRVMNRVLRKKKQIYVFGTDQELLRSATAFGLSNCFQGWSGDALEAWQHERFNLVYLDYCGLPTGSKNHNPRDDMQRASELLQPGGVLATTFLKSRCTNVFSMCVNMCPDSMHIQRVYEYFDTSPMIFIVYSARKLPPIGPVVGSIVSVPPWLGRVDTLFVNGVQLTHVYATRGHFKPVLKNQSKIWEEPFTAIRRIVKQPPSAKIRPTLLRRSNRSSKKRDFYVAFPSTKMFK